MITTKMTLVTTQILKLSVSVKPMRDQLIVSERTVYS